MIKIMTNKNKNNIIITKTKLIVRNLYLQKNIGSGKVTVFKLI